MSFIALAFLVVYLVLLALAIARRPIYGLCAYLMAFYFHPPARWWGEDLPNWRWSLTAAVVTMAVILYRNNGRMEGLRFVETKIFALFVVFVFLQSPWVIDSEAHLEYLNLVVNFLILMLMLHGALRDEEDLKIFIIVAMIGCSYFGYLGAIRTVGGRLDGIGGPSIESSNQMSQHLAAILFSGSYLLFVKQRRIVNYLFILVLLAVIVKTIVMAGSRGVYLAIALTGLVALVTAPKMIRKQMYLFFVLAAVFGSIGFGDKLLARFEGVAKDEYGEIADMSARSRLVIAEAQFVMFKEAPWFGQGHKATLSLSPLYIPQEYLTNVYGNQQAGRASHNFFLSVLVDHGLIGASLYFFVIFKCVSRLPLILKMSVSENAKDLKLLLIGLIMALLSLMIAGLSSDHKSAETATWFYALIPMYFARLKNFQNDH